MDRTKRVLVVGLGDRAGGALRAVLEGAGYEVAVAATDGDVPAGSAPGDYAAVLAAVQPLDERTREQLHGLTAQLERQIALLDSVTRNTEACLAFLDHDFNFVWVNTAYAEKCGHSNEELLGRNHFHFFPDPENQAIFERVRQTGQPYLTKEKPFVYPDQPERGVTYWNWSLTPVKSPLGEISGFDFSLVDVTDEVRARQEIDRLRAETSALLEGSRAVLRNRSFEEAARAIFDSCKGLLGATAGYIALLSGEGTNNDLVFLDAGGAPCSVDPSLPMPIRGLRADAYRTGRPVYDNDFAASDYARYLPEGHALLDNVLFAPMVIDGSPAGLLGLANKPGGFTDDDARMAMAFAELAAVALANSRTLESLERSEERYRAVAEALEEAYKREHRIADTLQRALITEVDIELPGYEISARYQPALSEAQVGGDFYDVFQLNDGRVALVMGDVSGKGLKAAAYTAMAKYTLRAYAYEDPSPRYVLERLNDALCQSSPVDLFVTIFYGILDPVEHVITYGAAGHDRPLVYGKTAGCVVSLDAAGCAAGVTIGCQYPHGALKLRPGDVLLIYTDGITEARSGGTLFGVDGLSRTLAANADGDSSLIVHAVFEAAYNAGGGQLRDDAALLVIKASRITPRTTW